MAAEGSKRTICIEGSKRSWRTHREAAEDVVVGVVVVRPDPVRARADALVGTAMYLGSAGSRGQGGQNDGKDGS